MDLATHDSDSLPAPLATVVESARAYTQASRAANTLRSQASQWKRFTAWCAGHALSSLPAAPETVALYLAASANTLKAGSLACALAAIKAGHAAASLPFDGAHPALRQVWEGIRRTKGTRQTGKAAVLPADLRAMVAACGNELRGQRNKAILLFGFASALRRSELVALDVADLTFSRQGVSVLVRRSKTDQAGAGEEVHVPYGRDTALCPVAALRHWLDEAGIGAGAVFRPLGSRAGGERLTDRSVANIVKEAAEAAGLDPSRYSGHSLRAGLATAAALAGAGIDEIMRHTRHRSVKVALGYVRAAEKWSANAAGRVL